MAKNKKNTKFLTKSIHTGNKIDETGSAVTPLHLTSTFRQPSFSSSEQFVYSRTGGPTIDALEENFAMLEDAKFSFAFASGMAAMSAIFLMFKPGDHVLISQNVYGGVFRLVTKVLNDNGVDFDFIDTTNLKIIKDSIRDNTKLIHLETPSNPLLEIADISSVSKICKPKNIPQQEDMSDESELKLGRNDKVELIAPSGERVKVKFKKIDQYLMKGYTRG